jgi:hypothetical protein
VTDTAAIGAVIFQPPATAIPKQPATGYQDGGWQEHYFEPMKRYFGEDR